MSFIHEDRDFADLIRIVADETELAPGLVEKDYWVTHTLWALHRSGLEVWFKGGTSLSKGFSLINRFSEDLDLRIEPGTEPGLPQVGSWTSENAGPVSRRRAFFEALGERLRVPGAEVRLAPDTIDSRARGAEYRVEYPGRYLRELSSEIRPFVLLEVGAARVTPYEIRALTSFIHERLVRSDQIGEFDDNRPTAVRCVHPVVTLIEKLDAILRRYPRSPMDSASFIRHYEDAARIIQKIEQLPPLEGTLGDLVEDMVTKKQVRALPRADDPAFSLDDEDRRAELMAAHGRITPMYWGPRLSLDEACWAIRTWLERALPDT